MNLIERMLTRHTRASGRPRASGKRPFAQGDLTFVPTNEDVPEGAVLLEPEDGSVMLAHSESGHHHVLEAPPTVAEVRRMGERLWLTIKQETQVRHVKTGDDAHLPIVIPPGRYRVHRGREMTPEGWARVTD